MTQYVFGFIFDTLGVVGEDATNDAAPRDVDVYYGNGTAPEECRIVIRENKNDLIWPDILHEKVSENDFDRLIPFDVIHAVGAFLTDEVNKNLPPHAYDNHGRLKYDHSYQAKNQFRNVPIVNVYVMFLRALLKRKLSVEGAPMWPDGKRYAIGLSHDVDIPEKYGMLKAPWRSKNLGLRADVLNNLKRLKDGAMKAMDRDPDNFWLFEEIMNAEEQFGFQSTFFFATANQFGEWGSKYDVYYDVAAYNFEESFCRMVDRGFEVGLHASYNAHMNTDRFALEKERLEKYCGTKVKGLRHHFWHMGNQVESALIMHEQVGFEYDSSIAFNDQMGFRRNVAFPYNPWNQNGGRAIKTTQLPVFCMDGNLFYQPIAVEEAVKNIVGYIEIIKKFEGIGVIDWHVRTSYPANVEFQNWGMAYLELLDYLSGDSTVWVSSLDELDAWLRNRKIDSTARGPMRFQHSHAT